MTIQHTGPAWAAKLDDPDVQLGAHVNNMRALMGASQTDLGAVLGLTQATISRKLRGETGITFPELLKLAAFFEVSVEDLIPPRYAGRRVIGGWYTPRDSNPEPAGMKQKRLASKNTVRLGGRRGGWAA